MTARKTRFLHLGVAALAPLLLVASIVAWLNLRGESPLESRHTEATSDPGTIARGAYLARAGNCIGCHTARGSAEYAGGREVDTPFGTIHAPNLTPDRETGIGEWSAAEFWRAMHNGRSRDGRLLYPAFPYPNFTLISREDSDAIYAFLQSLPAVRQPNREHRLRFPYNLQASLAVWRALYFRAAPFEARADRSRQWNRGSYLVRGLGHCIACHSGRNALGATTGDFELGGGLIPMQNWYAPSLASSREAGVADWQADEVVALLKNGVSTRGSVMGPMAEVVFRSTQYLSVDDLSAMAVFLQTLPQVETKLAPATTTDGELLRRGEQLYGEQCANCHGDEGQGAPGMVPPLAGNRAVVLVSPNNVVKAIVHGGFAPTTAGNPRPFGMPPFFQTFTDDQLAAVATYVRQSWGNAAPAVGPLDVRRAR